MADAKVPSRRLTRETKGAKTTTEFILAVIVIVLVLISASMVKSKPGSPDTFVSHQAWLYVAIMVGAYSVSRGLAKSGVREYPDDSGNDGDDS